MEIIVIRCSHSLSFLHEKCFEDSWKIVFESGFNFSNILLSIYFFFLRNIRKKWLLHNFLIYFTRNNLSFSHLNIELVRL